MQPQTILLALIVLGGLLALPIVAIVRTGRIRDLEARIARLEAARHMTEPPVEVPVPPVPIAAPSSERLELIIGRSWTGLVAIALIIVATAFFLKYAFENRWIGERGRIGLGAAAGLTLIWAGYRRHRRGWRYLSQVLTGGGLVILYLAVYGAFAYYHFIGQPTAFVILAILVALSHGVAMAYHARSIALLALAGGFLVPPLLASDTDQYGVLFTYIAILDLGMLGVVIARSWRWIGSLGYLGTQLLFWGWYSQHYDPGKRFAALLFQAIVFVIFVAADLAPNIRHRNSSREEWIRLAVSPFIFYAICYALLNGDHHGWMAPLTLLLAAVYAALARAQLSLCPADRRARLVTLGTALTFGTLAVPIQLDSNWITIAWSLEALVLLWVAIETGTAALRQFSGIVFTLALGRFLLLDSAGPPRGLFTPVLNRYFLGMLTLAACLCGAAWFLRRSEAAVKTGLLAFGVFWLGSSVESYSYFAGRAVGLDDAHHWMWAARLSLSLLWSVYAGLLTAAGFRFHQRSLRVAGLVLFGITLMKVLTLDLSELREFYRIVALLILGLVLLAVAWKYERNLRRGPTS